MRASGQIDLRKLEAILSAAERLFAARGPVVSMVEIAAEAKVSKQTLYNRFATKADLVRALARRRSEAFTAVLDSEGDAEETLMRFAENVAAGLSDAQHSTRLRTVVMMSPTTSDVASAFYEGGPLETLRRLALWLDDQDRRNALRVPHPEHAAEMLLGMIVGDDHLKVVLRMEAGATIARAREAVRRFMKAFAPH